MKKLLAVTLALLCAPLYAAEAKQDVLLDTMQKELKRNFTVLKKQNPSVYYLSYFAQDSVDFEAAAAFGEIFYEKDVSARELDVDARVGSPKLDNTHEFKGMYEDNISLSTVYLPIENNPAAIKNGLWRKTEAEVKKAQDQFLKVQTDAAIRAKNEDESNDFSAPLKPVNYYNPVKAPDFDKEKMKAMLKELSLIAKDADFLLNYDVRFRISTKNRYIVTSEGSSVVEGGTLIRLYYSFYTRNADGMETEVFNAYDGFSLSDIPAQKVIAKDMAKDLENAKKIVNAPAMEPFSGPVILKGKAAGVFFHEILGHRVEGHRQKSEAFAQTFTKQVGKEVVSPILSVYDDPTLSHYNGTPLRGFYEYDDDGVKSQRVTIIKDGTLKNFLMGRSPINNFPQSNGHGRKEIGNRTVSRMGNTIAEVKNPVTYQELKKMLKEEIKKQGKPYGLIVDDVQGGLTPVGRSSAQSFKVEPTLIYRVFPDDRPDEVVRGLNIVGTPLASFAKIAAGADDVEIFNGNCGAESGWVPVSAISPSILITELEMEKVEKSVLKLPILPPPSADNSAKGGK
ncbi:TldD protein [Elusimicrobium posterum]|uniref:TldD/PmbA family protein n=1 Tax=Elusimicrobium posterum TaxID=3116653 RepID=UPI003C744714